eukprot:2957251-Rhodomonas_salina.6
MVDYLVQAQDPSRSMQVQLRAMTLHRDTLMCQCYTSHYLVCECRIASPERNRRAAQLTCEEGSAWNRHTLRSVACRLDRETRYNAERHYDHAAVFTEVRVQNSTGYIGGQCSDPKPS